MNSYRTIVTHIQIFGFLIQDSLKYQTKLAICVTAARQTTRCEQQWSDWKGHVQALDADDACSPANAGMPPNNDCAISAVQAPN